MARLEDLLQEFAIRRIMGYGPRPIPDPLDARVHLLVGLIDGSGRNADAGAILSRMAQHHGSLLVAYAGRLASQAVRKGDPELIREGLKAAAFGSRLDDPREAIMILSLLYRSLEKLKADPSRFFGEASGLGDPYFDTNLRGFPSRSEEDRSIGAMGYIEGSDEGGFRYVRTW